MLFSPAAPGCRSARLPGLSSAAARAGWALPGSAWSTRPGERMECGHKCEPSVTVCVCCSGSWAEPTGTDLAQQPLGTAAPLGVLLVFFFFASKIFTFAFLEKKVGEKAPLNKNCLTSP